MSNLTVSSAVDTFMQASNQAAMRAALGGTGPLAQYVAFLASYGNDSTGVVGDPTHSFAWGGVNS
jgi:hypothetical protein